MDPSDRTTTLRIPLGSLTWHVQLLQRQILRANGLVNLERDQMLGNVMAMLIDLQHLDDGIAALNGCDDLPSVTLAPEPLR